MEHFIFTLLISIITVLIIRILKKSYSHQYFSIYQLIFSDEDPFNFWGLMIILAPPFLGSIFLSLLFRRLDYVLLYGFLTSFFTIWPVIMYTRHLLPPGAYNKRKSIYFMYFLYTIIYIVLSFGGFCLSNSIFNINSSLSRIIILYDKCPNIIQGLIDNSLWIIILTFCTYVYNKVKKNIKEVSKEING